MATTMETLSTMAREDEGLRASLPDVFDAIWALQRAAIEKESTLDSKTRALISFSIGVSKQDEGCIAAVGMALAKLGATVEEVADAMGVVILMNGGPGHVWATHALAAYKEIAGAA